MLLINGADPEIAVDSGDTPLHIACQEGHYDCVATLLNHGKYKYLACKAIDPQQKGITWLLSMQLHVFH